MWRFASRSARAVRAAGVVLASALSLGGLGLLGGCEFEKPPKFERPGGTLSDGPAPMASIAMQGTVGSVAYAEGGLRLMRVRGYGLVVGLVDKGSRRCPESLRNYLADSIRRTRMSDPYRRKTGHEPSANELIASSDTAVVLVEGEIPAGAIRGRPFDVRITAVDEDTTSLVGGILLKTDLKVFHSISPAQVIEGKTLATAGGPIFVNPFRATGAATSSAELREGHIIAGGTNVEDRKLTLATSVESYATVRQIQDAINMRFKADPPTARADSPRTVTLQVPPDYRGREGRFLELVLHLPLSSSSAENQARGKLLAAELSQPDAPHREIGLSLEGIGKPAIEFIRPLYAHTDRQVNFTAAVTGIRLGDSAAMDVLIGHVRDTRSPMRYQAIREMGESQMPARAVPVLRELLDGEDTQMRILAYESLRLLDRTSVAQVAVGRPANFLLEIVACQGRPMIYARRTKAPRIALIGGDRLLCRPPLLYADVESPVTISAKADDNMVAILKKDPARPLGPYYTPLSVPILTKFLGHELRTDAEGKLQGLGLDYGRVVAILYRLCESRAIDADLRWEDAATDQLFGPLDPLGRPESEL